jgi:hypothetical protein
VRREYNGREGGETEVSGGFCFNLDRTVQKTLWLSLMNLMQYYAYVTVIFPCSAFHERVDVQNYKIKSV